MASLFKRPGSPYFFCAYSKADGSRVKVTTKQANREEAWAFCLRLVEAEKAAKRKTMTTAHARKLLNDILERLGDEALEAFTVRTWCDEWLASKKESRAASTSERYRKPLSDFVAGMGERADLPLRAVSPADIRRFRDAQRKAGRAAATVNFALKAVAAAMGQAHRLGYLPVNPAMAVDPLPEHRERVEKGIFTAEEIARVVKACPSKDWEGVVLLGAFAGLRLNDCLTLKWGNVDLPARVLRVTPQKTARTGRELVIPMHSEIEEFLLAHPAGKRGSDFVFPSLAVLGVGGNNGASRRFARIVGSAGIANATLREGGKGVGRAVNERSFHSLRHTYVTALSSAGVAVEVRQMLAGHSSEGQNLHYTHPEIAELRVAIEKLPRISL